MRIFKKLLKKLPIEWNLKTIFLALIFSLVCTALSLHLFIKTDYWQNNFSLPMHLRLKISYNGSNFQSLNFKINQADISEANYRVNEEYKFNTFIKITAPMFYQTYNFNLKPNEPNRIKIATKDFFNSNIDIKSFKINNTEFVNNNNFKNNDYVINVKPDGNINFSITCKPADTIKTSMFKQISVGALFITILGYFCIFMIIFTQIFQKGLKSIFQNICKVIKDNKIAVILLGSFLAFYLLENLYIILHLNQLNWIGNGDSPYITDFIWHSTPKRFHPYFFLALYPLFDTLVIITKHLFLSIGLIYALLASLSVMFLYKALELIMPKLKTLAVILSCIYGFSWAQIHLSQAFDLYIITGFYLCLLLYMITKELKQKEYNYKNMAIIVILSALTLGVTIQNSITALILVLPVFLIKRNPKVISICLLSFVLLVGIFTQFKSLTCNGLAWQHLFYKNTKGDLKTWVRTDNKILSAFTHETLRQPIICQENNKKIYKNTVKTFSVFFFTLVLLTLLSLIIKSKNIPHFQKQLFYTAFIALIYNFTANYFWCPTQGLLFSLNHLALWFILLGSAITIINNFLENKPQNQNIFINIISIWLITFMLFQAVLNHMINQDRHRHLLEKSPITYNVLEMKK